MTASGCVLPIFLFWPRVTAWSTKKINSKEKKPPKSELFRHGRAHRRYLVGYKSGERFSHYKWKFIMRESVMVFKSASLRDN